MPGNVVFTRWMIPLAKACADRNLTHSQSPAEPSEEGPCAPQSREQSSWDGLGASHHHPSSSQQARGRCPPGLLVIPKTREAEASDFKF